MSDALQIRVHGDAALPTLIYLPGLHGDWLLVTRFRLAVAGRVRFVEFTYPNTVTWSLDDYSAAVAGKLREHGIVSGWLLAESFGSQVAWPLMQSPGFRAEGLILAGGFAQHPWLAAVRATEWLIDRAPACRCGTVDPKRPSLQVTFHESHKLRLWNSLVPQALEAAQLAPLNQPINRDQRHAQYLGDLINRECLRLRSNCVGVVKDSPPRLRHLSQMAPSPSPSDPPPDDPRKPDLERRVGFRRLGLSWGGALAPFLAVPEA